MPLIIPLASALVLRAAVMGMSSLGLLSWALRALLANMMKRQQHGGLVCAVVSGSDGLEVATIIPALPSSDSAVLSRTAQASPASQAGPERSYTLQLTSCHVLLELEEVTTDSDQPTFSAFSVHEQRASDTVNSAPINSPHEAHDLTSQEEAAPKSHPQVVTAPAPPTPPPPTTTHKIHSPPAWLRWHKRKATRTILPCQKGPPRKTLVLDLDQTLVECLHLNHAAMSPPNFIYTDKEGLRANVWLRPHLMEFLEAVSQDFEVVLFTAAAQRHADAVLSHVDPDRALVQHRLYGHHTVAAPQWAWVKDLSRLGRDLSQTLIIDDCSTAALFQPESWVSIAPFTHLTPGWRDDAALLDILYFLRQRVLPATDVRQAIREHYSQVACRPYVVQSAAEEEEEGQLPGADAASCASAAGCMADSMHRVQSVRHCLSVAASHG